MSAGCQSGNSAHHLWVTVAPARYDLAGTAGGPGSLSACWA